MELAIKKSIPRLSRQYSKSSQQANKSKPPGVTQKHAWSDRSTPAPKPVATTSTDRPTEIGSVTVVRRPVMWYVTVERRKVMMLTDINIL